MSFNVSYIYDLRDQMSKKLRGIGNSVDRLSRKNKVAQWQMRKYLMKTKSAVQSLHSSFKNLAGAYLGFHAIKSVNASLVEYERALNRANALTKATAKEQRILREVSAYYGRTTEKTSTEIANTAGEMGLLGVAVSDIKTLMPSVIDLSTALGKDLAETGRLAVNMMQKLNIPLTQTEKILNKVATAATSSGVNIDALSHAFQNSGATIVSNGLNIDESFALLSVGYEKLGDRVGTAFEAMIRQVSMSEKTTSMGAKVLKRYGLTFDDINPKVHSVTSIIEKLTPIMENGADAFDFFGTEGKRFGDSLRPALDKVKELQKEISTNTTSLNNMAQEMRTGLPGASDRSKSALDGLVKTLGAQGLTGILIKTHDAIAGFANFLSENAYIVKYVIKVVTLVAKIYLVTKAVRIARIAFIALAAVTPFGIARAGIVAFIALLQVIPDMMDKIYEKFNIFKSFGNFLSKAFGGIDTSNLDGLQLPTGYSVNDAGELQKANVSSASKGSTDFTGKLDINMNGLPQGATTSMSSQGNSNMSVGTNSIFAQ